MLVAVTALLVNTTPAHAADPGPAVQRTFDKLMAAIKVNNRDAFVADATDAVKQAITPSVMEALNKQLGSRLSKGYQATHLCQLKQAGHQVHFWKVTFKDEGDEFVIRIPLKDGKVAGFLAH
jgi:hypothetical protein